MSLYFYVTGEDASCPIELIPPRVVVKYGDPISVNCTTSAEELDGLGWESSEGGASAADTQRYVTLTVQSVTQWGSHPMCFLNFAQTQCSTRLGLVIYSRSSRLSTDQFNALTTPDKPFPFFQHFQKTLASAPALNPVKK